MTEIFTSLGASAPGISVPATRVLGFFHLGTGVFLMYLVCSTVLNIVFGYSLPAG